MFHKWIQGDPLYIEDKSIVYKGNHPDHGACVIKCSRKTHSPSTVFSLAGGTHDRIILPHVVLGWNDETVEILPFIKDDILDTTVRSFQEARDITLQVAQGVEYLHKKGVVHKDVRPNNIFYSWEMGARLFDLDWAQPPHNQYRRVITDDVVPPEGSFRNIRIGFQYDVWSIGWLLKSLSHPYDPSFNSIVPPKDMPAEIMKVIAKATNLRPASRQPNATAFIDDLINAAYN